MFTFLKETLTLALRNLRLHKLRSLLTALGIIFGVAAVIIMVAIGEGGKQKAKRQMELLGATNVVVQSERPPESAESSGRTQRVLSYGLKRVDLARLEMLPKVKKVVPVKDTEQRVSLGDTRAPGATAIATTPDVFEVINLRPARGVTFTQQQYDQGEAVCVLGATVARQLFPFQDPLGQQIKVGVSGMSTIMLTVIGVLEPTGLRPDGGSGGGGIIKRDLEQDVYFPLTLSRAAFGDQTIRRQAGSMERKQIELTEVWLQVESMADVEQVASIAQNIMELSHSKSSPDFAVKAPIEILRQAEDQQRTFNIILGGIASISLIVGGIGIMNIMLATVTERTKEIGIRRALGAKRKHITVQFLIETTTISIGGGLIGITLGIGVAKLLPLLVNLVSQQNFPTNVTTWSVAGSFIVSALIGIGFGLYPAVMAARMNPIEALRHE